MSTLYFPFFKIHTTDIFFVHSDLQLTRTFHHSVFQKWNVSSLISWYYFKEYQLQKITQSFLWTLLFEKLHIVIYEQNLQWFTVTFRTPSLDVSTCCLICLTALALMLQHWVLCERECWIWSFRGCVVHSSACSLYFIESIVKALVCEFSGLIHWAYISPWPTLWPCGLPRGRYACFDLLLHCASDFVPRSLELWVVLPIHMPLRFAICRPSPPWYLFYTDSPLHPCLSLLPNTFLICPQLPLLFNLCYLLIGSIPDCFHLLLDLLH